MIVMWMAVSLTDALHEAKEMLILNYSSLNHFSALGCGFQGLLPSPGSSTVPSYFEFPEYFPFPEGQWLLYNPHLLANSLIDFAGVTSSEKSSLITPSSAQPPIVVQWLSRDQLFVTTWIAACWASLSFSVSWSLLRLMSLELEMPPSHLIPCCSLLLPASVFPSIRH